MSLQFKSMNELVDYLSTLEQRVNLLERENTQLHAGPAPQTDAMEVGRIVNRVLPQTNLLSPSFFKRAFTVWGHFFVANFIIGVIITIGYLCLMMLMFGSILGNFAKLQK
jgi:hypothetical protein